MYDIKQSWCVSDYVALSCPPTISVLLREKPLHPLQDGSSHPTWNSKCHRRTAANRSPCASDKGPSASHGVGSIDICNGKGSHFASCNEIHRTFCMPRTQRAKNPLKSVSLLRDPHLLMAQQIMQQSIEFKSKAGFPCCMSDYNVIKPFQMRWSILNQCSYLPVLRELLPCGKLTGPAWWPQSL